MEINIPINRLKEIRSELQRYRMSLRDSKNEALDPELIELYDNFVDAEHYCFMAIEWLENYLGYCKHEWIRTHIAEEGTVYKCRICGEDELR